MLCILLGVTDTSNGGEPTDRKERNRQRRQNYAQMDPQKKDELLKKRRESYQQKKAKLQSTQSVTGTQQSALTQLESTPAVKGALNHMFLGFLQFIAPMFNS
jgi:hypothetical protein